MRIVVVLLLVSLLLPMVFGVDEVISFSSYEGAPSSNTDTGDGKWDVYRKYGSDDRSYRLVQDGQVFGATPSQNAYYIKAKSYIYVCENKKITINLLHGERRLWISNLNNGHNRGIALLNEDGNQESGAKFSINNNPEIVKYEYDGQLGWQSDPFTKEVELLEGVNTIQLYRFRGGAGSSTNSFEYTINQYDYFSDLLTQKDSVIYFGSTPPPSHISCVKPHWNVWQNPGALNQEWDIYVSNDGFPFRSKYDAEEFHWHDDNNRFSDEQHNFIAETFFRYSGESLNLNFTDVDHVKITKIHPTMDMRQLIHYDTTQLTETQKQFQIDSGLYFIQMRFNDSIGNYSVNEKKLNQIEGISMLGVNPELLQAHNAYDTCRQYGGHWKTISGEMIGHVCCSAYGLGKFAEELNHLIDNNLRNRYQCLIENIANGKYTYYFHEPKTQDNAYGLPPQEDKMFLNKTRPGYYTHLLRHSEEWKTCPSSNVPDSIRCDAQTVYHNGVFIEKPMYGCGTDYNFILNKPQYSYLFSPLVNVSFEQRDNLSIKKNATWYDGVNVTLEKNTGAGEVFVILELNESSDELEFVIEFDKPIAVGMKKVNDIEGSPGLSHGEFQNIQDFTDLFSYATKSYVTGEPMLIRLPQTPQNLVLYFNESYLRHNKVNIQIREMRTKSDNNAMCLNDEWKNTVNADVCLNLPYTSKVGDDCCGYKTDDTYFRFKSFTQGAQACVLGHKFTGDNIQIYNISTGNQQHYYVCGDENNCQIDYRPSLYQQDLPIRPFNISNKIAFYPYYEISYELYGNYIQAQNVVILYNKSVVEHMIIDHDTPYEIDIIHQWGEERILFFNSTPNNNFDQYITICNNNLCTVENTNTQKTQYKYFYNGSHYVVLLPVQQQGMSKNLNKLDLTVNHPHYLFNESYSTCGPYTTSNENFCSRNSDFFCDPRGFWNNNESELFSNTITSPVYSINNRTTQKSTFFNTDIKTCCPQDTCWDGIQCVQNMNILFSQKYHGDLRCVNGVWKNQTLMFDWTTRFSGYCEDDQCYAQLSGGLGGCVQNQTNEGIYYCMNNEWESRVVKLAKAMADKISHSNYVLHCGKLTDIANELNIVSHNVRVFSFPPYCNSTINNEYPCLEYGCVMKQGNKRHIGLILTGNAQNISKELGVDIINDCKNGCNAINSGTVYYDEDEQFIIYTRESNFFIRTFQNFWRFIRNLFSSSTQLTFEQYMNQPIDTLFIKKNGNNQIVGYMHPFYVEDNTGLHFIEIKYQGYTLPQPCSTIEGVQCTQDTLHYRTNNMLRAYRVWWESTVSLS